MNLVKPSAMSNKSGPTIAAAITALSGLQESPPLAAAVQVTAAMISAGDLTHILEEDACEGHAEGQGFLVAPPPVVEKRSSDTLNVTVTEHVPLLVTAKID